MSLLLDALKKAAEEKQKTVQHSSVAKADAGRSENIKQDELITLQTEKAGEEVTPVGTEKNNKEITLDTEVLQIDSLDDDHLTLDEMEDASQKTELENDVAEVSRESELPPEQDTHEINKARFSVSDEALSLLINKTNRDVKRNRVIVYVSVLIISLLILTVGGIYYFLDMQEEVAAVERKHQIAMRSMQTKINKDKLPEKSAVIRKLVSDGDLDEKVKSAKKHLSVETSPRQMKTAASPRSEKTAVSASGFSIQKTNKTDPLGEKLTDAWLAYESGNYREAKKIYSEVLSTESNNRDALLGLGAIAIIEKDNAKAKEAYMALLTQDPNDPIANAALTSLQNDKASLESHLLSMLQKNPQAPQLNFELGNIYAQQSKWKLAQQSYFQAWQMDGENADYLFNLAVSLDQLGKHKQAVNFYKDSLLKSNNKQVSFSRSSVKKRIAELLE